MDLPIETSGTKMHDIIVSRGQSLELLRPDPNTGKVHTMLTVEVFGIIRSLMAFRLTGGIEDCLVVGFDSGQIVILEYVPAKNVFEKLLTNFFLIMGAIEKQKLVYILNRDPESRLTIFSLLGAHESNTLVYHMVGVDEGFENTMFACLKFDYEEAETDPTGEEAIKTQQTLAFYELDFGLTMSCESTHANFLVSVPGGKPSGLLICSEKYLTYKNLGDKPDIRCPIPRCRNYLDDPERAMIFVCSATHKTKSTFFFLAQTEQGDIFKITLETDDDVVTEIKLKYFDSIPVSNSMCVLKTGFLFVASEFGNQ
ncbi:hypothetical protein TSAR_009510 [Trichomalopsis sarcophagae]|uniref:RSE1/DDB1/CPSF1 first beta-propeller domain-containing protein n=1 Tax=Trichomalopsis sarcophagae TaxID=543379 RepID=A0A232EWQ3_9HYME|nr:hypothetical protein TSAR_009510 [Trichomalopsis sarcophagae]